MTADDALEAPADILVPAAREDVIDTHLAHPEIVFPMVSSKMRRNAELVVTESRRLGLAPHVAARQLAQNRVREAMHLRGQIVEYP